MRHFAGKLPGIITVWWSIPEPRQPAIKLRNSVQFFLLVTSSYEYLSSLLAKVLIIRKFHFVDRASRYNRVKKTQLDAQLFLSIFRQPLHVSAVSRPIIRRYKPMYTTTGTYYSF
jgi:hypothetical protein